METKFPPGPKSHFLGLDFAERFKKDPLGTACDLKKYGDIAHIRLGPYEWYQLNTPELIKEAFVTKSKVFGKTDRFKQILGTVDGNGLVLSEGDFWLRQRRIIQPSFHHERLAEYATIMIDKTDETIAAWQEGMKLDIADGMTSLTLKVISRILFGLDVSSETKKLGDAVNVLSKILFTEFTDSIQIPDWVPLPSKIEKREAIKVIDDLIARAIENANNGGASDTILASILAAVDREGDGKGMTKLQARDEAITMFNAGHDSTASSLAWAWYELCRHKEIYNELIAQIDALGGAKPTLSDLQKVPLAQQVVKETVRLYPTAWTIPRQANEDTELGAYKIPRGSLVNIFPYVIQRDEKYFSRPNDFIPSRFSPENEAQIPHFANVPFGAGPRACIGREFALMEMQLILIRVSQKFRFHLQNNTEIEPSPLISLEPKGGVPVVVESR